MLELRLPPVFCCAVTFDAPLALAAPTALTQEVLDEDAHEHPLVVVTVTLAEPPVLEKLNEVGETEYEHGGGGAGVDPPDTVPPAVALNCETMGAVRLSAAALFWLDVPVGMVL